MKKAKVFLAVLIVAVANVAYVDAASNSAKYEYTNPSATQGVYYNAFISMTGLPIVNDEVAYTLRLYCTKGHEDDLEGATVALRVYTDKKSGIKYATVSKKIGLSTSASGLKAGTNKTSWGKLALYENCNAKTVSSDHKNGYRNVKKYLKHELKATTS